MQMWEMVISQLSLFFSNLRILFVAQYFTQLGEKDELETDKRKVIYF